MYKDKDKQREADRERQRRYRESHPISGKSRDKAVTDKESIVTPFVESPGVTSKSVTGFEARAFESLGQLSEANKQASKKYRDSMTGKGMTIANERPNEPSNVIPKCAIPNGDTDVSTVKALHQSINKPKRGKDIKCFADLPSDVQQSINSMSMVDGKICPTVKANRTAIAVNHQHQFPDQCFPHNTLRLTPVGRVGDSASEWMKANKKGEADTTQQE